MSWHEKRWRDVAKSNIEAIGMGNRWYELCQDGRLVQALL